MSNAASIQGFDLPRNYFPLTNKKFGTYKVGKIYPVASEYLLPGDSIKIKIENVTRQMATISPSYSQYTITYRTFFVALRNLWPKFPEWLTGYKQYDKTKKFEEDVPRWNVSDIKYTQPGTLWHALENPYDCIPDIMPADFERQAYAYIYDRYFRYQPFYESILVEGEPGTWQGEELLNVVRDRDYFTTMLPYQQLADPMALPITGDTSTVWSNDIDTNPTDLSIMGIDDTNTYKYTQVMRKEVVTSINPLDSQRVNTMQTYGGNLIKDSSSLAVGHDTDAPSQHQHKISKNALNNNIVSMEDISSVTITMLRQAVQLQLFAEMLARTGVYYDDVLTMNWGTAPSDETLGYPIYIGGSKVNLITSEVLQTSATQEGQPLGQLGGHGLGVAESGEISYTTKEFGVLMVLMYIKTDNLYGGQGMDSKKLFTENILLPWIMLQHLSEQPVPKRELYCKSVKKPTIASDTSTITVAGADDETAATYNNDVLAYREIYDNWRYRVNRVFGRFTLQQRYLNDQKKITYNDYNWTQAIFFDIENPPAMNADFLDMKDDLRNYTVQESTEENQIEDAKLELDQFYIYSNVHIDCWRVLDLFGTPGRMDHVI